MNKTKKSCKEIREQVVLFLLFITSEDCLQAYENSISQEKLAFELSRIWFDEIYIPGMIYLVDGLKGNFSENNAREFEKCFTEKEFKSLERFHRFFELRMDMLSKDMKKKGTIPQNDSWQHLKKHASYLADELEPNADEKRKHLERMVKDGLLDDGKLLKGSIRDKWVLPLTTTMDK
ncbi:hypothetical protein IIC38_00100 [candidate division KSB1 bacterium]|nr:hypothetical protein [candidate division KSB1 bacterium]